MSHRRLGYRFYVAGKERYPALVTTPPANAEGFCLVAEALALIGASRSTHSAFGISIKIDVE
jgi:hypothetical protein